MQWLLLTILALATLGSVAALSCRQCQPDHECPALPNDGKCHPARRPCSCCDECAGLRGDDCGPFTARCHPDLVCVNENGEEKETVQWHEKFKGVCKRSKAERAERACKRLNQLFRLFNSTNGRPGRFLRRWLKRLYKRCLAKYNVN
ncbi:hypothetical protein LOTGIDRAFT_228219 [Lottia gigantea]|uniref:IGFBP N-terminal domain-containing protein n=1 Tax=Lottia gigantea TaxID=225164 RepID=V4A172_LOTGI|nr:hypothetical protein LOTGIDRAFT_228219 [Lottia gigantea]ESO97568.1 hypothetical protein LOTGIDRAFT_228219 [Lottia gigantea]